MKRLCVLFTLLPAALWAADPHLIEVVRNHDKEALQTLLKARPDVNTPAADGTTALQWAAHNNDLESVALLLKAGADASAQSRYHVSPLSEAARYGSGAMIGALLKAGADPNTLTTERGETVLMTAARTGNTEAVRVLLEHGANINAKESFRGQTSLMWAAAENHADVVQLLLAHGADAGVRSTDRDTTPPKLMAGTPAAPINRGGLTALIFAARQGSLAAAEALLKGGANINMPDVDGNSPLLIAILNNHDDLAQMLIDRGADVNAANKDGRTALFTAVDQHDVDWSVRPFVPEKDRISSLDIIRSLVEHKANVNAQLTALSIIKKAAQDSPDRTLAAGATAFMRASRSGDVALMKYLLEKGADPRQANKDGANALMVAAGLGYTDSNRATEPQALEAVKLCVSLGLDVNTSTDKGETALHGASRWGANTIIQYLADKGGNVNAPNKQGLTPLDLAMGKGTTNGAPGLPKVQTAALIRQLGGNPGKEVTEVAKTQ